MFFDFIHEWWGILTIALLSAFIWLLLSIILYRPLFKRVYDILFSVVCLPVFFVLFIFIALAVKIEDRGPIFYCGKRLGRKGKTFPMFKFRSMKVNAPDIRLADGSTFNSDNDPRVTKIGRFLRKTSLDEIPQLLNILLGQMSFIGPRPDLPDAINLLTEEEKDKYKVLPGVTGYSQAYVRNSVVWKERLQYDCAYVKKLSFFFDLKIIFATIGTVLLRKNLYSAEIDKSNAGNDSIEESLQGLAEEESSNAADASDISSDNEINPDTSALSQNIQPDNAVAYDIAGKM